MKRVAKYCLPILLLSSAIAQTQGNDAERVLHRIMYTGFIEGHDEKVINGTGDAAAVTVIMGQPIRPEIIPNIVRIFDFAFLDNVKTTYGERPRAALFLLRSKDSASDDLLVKAQIEKQRERLTRIAQSVSAPAH